MILLLELNYAMWMLAKRWAIIKMIGSLLFNMKRGKHVKASLAYENRSNGCRVEDSMKKQQYWISFC